MTTQRDRDFFALVAPIRTVEDEREFEKIIKEKDEIKDIDYRAVKFGDAASVIRKTIQNKNFENVAFSWTKIENYDFRYCKFKRCIFNYTQIIDCEFHSCEFIDTNPNKIRISGTYIDPNSFQNCLFDISDQNLGTHLYQRLMNNSADELQPRFYRYSAFQFNRWSYLQSLYEFRNHTPKKSRSRFSYLLEYALRRLWSLTGAGVFLDRFFVTALFIVMIYSTYNYIYRDFMGLCDLRSFWDSIYFTVITLTTIGFGDVTPESLPGRIIVAVQGVTGFFLFATSASMIFRRVSP